MKKVVCIIVSVLICAACMNTASAALSQPTLASARCAILMHSSGEVLFEKDAHQARPIASVTKVMTLLLVFEAIEQGRISMADKVIGSEHASSMGGSQIWLEDGETLTVEEMIKAVTICSANDCAVALAEHLGGSEEAFVDMMNTRARELGMNDTVFKNACGLHEEGHVSSAYDVAVMSCELIKFERIKEYATTWETTLRDGASVLNNTNKMIRTYQGMTGLKTGFTKEAGYCLSGTAQRDGTTLIAVVLGAETSDKRNADVAALLNWGFGNYVTISPTPDQPLMPVPVTMGKKNSVQIELGACTPAVAKKGAQTVKTLTVDPLVRAPIAKGQQLGTLTVEQDGQVLVSVPVVAAEDVARLSFGDILMKILTVTFVK